MNSIRARVTAAFTASIALMLLAGDAGLVWFAHESAEREADATLQVAVERFRSEVSPTAGSGVVVGELREELEELRANGVAAAVFDASNQTVAKSQKNLPPWPHTGAGWRVRSLRFGEYSVVFGVPSKRSDAAIRREAIALLGLSLLAVLAASGGAWVVVGRTLSPIGDLSRQAAAASTDTLRVQLTAPSDDNEVTELVATLNAMLGRLSEAADERGRFYAAASHELRTPLQALQGHLELALNRERTSGEYREAVVEAHQQTQRLSTLVRDLLTLNRLHTGAPLRCSDAVDFSDICVTAVEANRPLANERRLVLSADIPVALPIAAPAGHLEMLARNLLENAVKYADLDGNVTVRAGAGPAPYLEVANTFNSEETLDPEKLFEPFYRPDASRNADTGGNGLGLAICKAVCVANGWTIRVEQTDDRVLFRVSFPNSQAPRA